MVTQRKCFVQLVDIVSLCVCIRFQLFVNVYFVCSCEDAEAFEVQDGGKSTGIFTKYLNRHILQSEKVTHVLEKVSEGRSYYYFSHGHHRRKKPPEMFRK